MALCRCHSKVLSTDVWTSTDKGLQVRIRLRYLLKKVLDIRSGEFGRDSMKSFVCQEDAATVKGWSMQRCQLDFITMIG